MSYGYDNKPWQQLSAEPVYDDQHKAGAVYAVTLEAPNGNRFFKLCRAYEARDSGKLFTDNRPVMVKLENRDAYLAAVATYYNKVARIDTSTAVGAALNKAAKKAKAAKAAEPTTA